MQIFIPQIKLQHFLYLGISIVLFSCVSTHQLELQNSVYQSLGLKKECRDNFTLYKEAASWLHVPYADASCSRTGVDCSCLVCDIYRTVYNKTLERNTTAILKNNCRKISKYKLRQGDLIFFCTGKSKAAVNHVGIYLKHNKFLHASVSRGVIVSDLSESYYQKTLVCGGRVK
ncbi:MAG: C40 family peptidase [Paludibacter sp.]